VKQEKHQTSKPNIWQVLMSTLAAALGVQTNKNRERDFSSGNIYVYLMAGLIFTVFFVVLMIIIVKTILHYSGV